MKDFQSWKLRLTTSYSSVVNELTPSLKIPLPTLITVYCLQYNSLQGKKTRLQILSEDAAPSLLLA